jgi:peptidoglycan/LPS O-acetylase OafA/YrhL
VINERFKIGGNGRAYLDLLRFMAANLVLLQHSSSLLQWPNKLGTGSLGVLIFFLLSGFLIFISCWNRFISGKSGFHTFLVDRFARIMTPYVPILVIVALANYFIPIGEFHQPGTATGWSAFIGNLFLLQDYPLFQVASKILPEVCRIRSYNTAEPFWTIPIEAFIYVVFAIIFFVWIHKQKVSRRTITILLIIAGPVFFYNIGGGAGHGLTMVWLYGAFGALILCHKIIPKHSWRPVGASLVIICFLSIFISICKDGWNPYQQGQGILIGLLLYGGFIYLESQDALSKNIDRISENLACYSYSLYLIHNTILCYFIKYFPSTKNLVVKSIIALLCAHLAAVTCYFLFERWYPKVGKAITERLRSYKNTEAINIK